MTNTIMEINKSAIDRWWTSGMLEDTGILAIDYAKADGAVAFVASSPDIGTVYTVDLVDSSGRVVESFSGMIGGKEVDKVGEELMDALRTGPSTWPGHGPVYRLS